MVDQNKDKTDGWIQVNISPDHMTASIDLHPPRGDGQVYTIDSVEEDLYNAGVTIGIDRSAIQESIEKSIKDHRVIKNCQVAFAKKMVESVPAHWQVKKSLIEPHEKEMSEEGGKINYKDVSRFVIVKKGEILAKLIDDVPGVTGCSVKGDEIDIKPKETINYQFGANVTEQNGTLFATSNGHFSLENGKISVEKKLEIKGDVDYSTGHIVFPGDVIIHGYVQDGFKVSAGQSIHVKQTMDASGVLAKGDLIVDGGIKGRNEAYVQVGGDMKVKFVENCLIDSHGDIIIAKSLMHCNVNTLGKVKLKHDGYVVGGQICAQNGVIVGYIGRSESPDANIHVGSDYRIVRKLHDVREHIKTMKIKLNTLKDQMKHKNVGEKIVRLAQNAEEALKKLIVMEEAYLKSLHTNKSACVIVAGHVEPQTRIQICDHSLLVEETQSEVVFYYATHQIGMKKLDEKSLQELIQAETP